MLLCLICACASNQIELHDNRYICSSDGISLRHLVITEGRHSVMLEAIGQGKKCIDLLSGIEGYRRAGFSDDICCFDAADILKLQPTDSIVYDIVHFGGDASAGNLTVRYLASTGRFVLVP